MDDFHKNNTYLPVVGITFLFGLAGWCYPGFLASIQYPLLGLLVLCIGLPHGATDFLLFRRLCGPVLSKKQVLKFFLFYLSAVFGYLAFWSFYPAPALILFIILSAYHFGQSNWPYLSASRWLTGLIHVAWGAFVLGGALLWHWDESSVIIQQLVGHIPLWSSQMMQNIQWTLLLFNILLLLGLQFSGHIRHRQLFREMITLSVLSFMLLNTPLLVGFAVYFSIWHSFASLLDQMVLFRRQWPSFSLVNYYQQAAPYTLLALTGLLVLILLQSFIFSDISLISLFFVLLACITLPHIFLMEEVYR